MSHAAASRVGPRFRRLAVTTTVLTYLLVSVGAIVRVTGSGMGCPDWPKCFGLFVPPMSVEELPPLGSYSYPPGWSVESFSPLTTWIEYLNRLLGALVGLAILATLIVAIVDFRRRKDVLLPTIGAFVGVLYAGWLGARVVAHELAPWMVTVHLGSAIAVVSCLVVAVVNASSTSMIEVGAGQKTASRAAFGVGAFALLQGAVGTQVRGLIEDVARNNPGLSRDLWLSKVGLMDLAHKNLSMLVVAACIVLVFVFRNHVREQVAAVRMAIAAALLSLAQLTVGLTLAGAALPKTMQVLHLTLAALMLGALTAAGILARRR
jgi:cytochrome c oxidase assembly protein subunit 15